jgi:hypothetical protein
VLPGERAWTVACVENWPDQIEPAPFSFFFFMSGDFQIFHFDYFAIYHSENTLEKRIQESV